MADVNASKIPTLEQGDNGYILDLANTIQFAKYAIEPLFEFISNTIRFPAPINGTLNDFDYSHQVTKPYLFHKKVDCICHPTLKIPIHINYQFSLAVENAGQTLSKPLIESVEFKNNSIAPPDANGRSTETIDYNFQANVDLSNIDAYWTSHIKIDGPVSGEACSDLGLWSPSMSSDVRVDSTITKQKVKLPEQHPISFTLSLEIPSYNTTHPNDLKKTKDGVYYSPSEYPFITDVSIKSLNLNRLINKVYEENQYFQKAVKDGVTKSFRDMTFNSPFPDLNLVADALVEVAAPLITSSFVGAINGAAESWLDSEEKSLQKRINNKLRSDLINTSGFNIFTKLFSKLITAGAWNQKDYPMHEKMSNHHGLQSSNKKTINWKDGDYITDSIKNHGTINIKDTIHNFGKIKNNGILNIEGSINNVYGDLTNEGIICGSGEIKGDLSNTGVLAAGNSAGGFLFGGTLAHHHGGRMIIELGGESDKNRHRTDTEYDFIDVTGDLIIDGGSLETSLIEGFKLERDQEFLIAKIDGKLIGHYEGLEEGDSVGMFESIYGHRIDLHISYAAGDGNDIKLYTEPENPAIIFNQMIT